MSDEKVSPSPSEIARKSAQLLDTSTSDKLQVEPEFAEASRPSDDLLKQLTAQTEIDSDVLIQVSNWLKRGMIGSSVLKGVGEFSYNKIQEFGLDPIPDGNFRYWHTEDLLDQVAGLLDRAIAHRSEWWEKLSKAFYVESEILQYLETDKIYLDEVRDGLYEVPYLIASYEASAEKSSLDALTDAAVRQSNIWTKLYSSANMQNQVTHEADAAWASSLSTYVAGHNLPFLVIKDGYVKVDKPDLIYDATANSTKFHLAIEDAAVGVELVLRRGESAAATQRLLSANRNRDWEEKNRLHKKQRADAARKTAEYKIAAFTAPDGALNYPDQMRLIQKRIARDCNDALSRMGSAALGLKQIYGYELALPPTIPNAINSRVANHRVLDDALIWVRNAIAWLTRFKQLDQNYVLPISLRSLIGEAAWEAVKLDGKLQIVLPQVLFEGQSHVRLRGVRGYVYGCGPEAGFWRVELTPPKQATTQHLNAAVPVNLDQSLLPSIVLSRVGSRLNAQEVEFVGTTALYNASPIGQWQIKITGQSTQRVSLNTISDVELEFAIALRSSQ